MDKLGHVYGTYQLTRIGYDLLKRTALTDKKANYWSAGYSANGMVYAREDENNMNGYHNYRQYFLGIDLDLNYIQTNKKWLKTVLYLADMIKWPAPAIEFGESGFKGHLFYY